MERKQNASLVSYGICYVLVLVILGVAYLTFVVWAQAILLLVGVTIQPIWVRPGVYGFGIVMGGFALFILLMLTEPYLREGVRRGQLGQRFRRLATILGGFLLLGLVAEEILIAMLHAAT